MHNQPFNLEKIDYKSSLKKKRRNLLKWTAAPVAIVFLLSFWFILPMILTHFSIADYKKGAYQPSRAWLVPLTWTSPEPFVAAFDSGKVDTRLGH